VVATIAALPVAEVTNRPSPQQSDNDVFNSLLSLFYFLFLFASSMFYPLAPLPGWFRTAAMANPITWQVDLLRFSSIGLSTDHLLTESVAFVLFAFVAFFFGLRTLQNPK
jgi:ABC-type polysaccharide/polyol phosphate export permease